MNLPKLRKLVRTPGLFLRDFLIKRHPVEYFESAGLPALAAFGRDAAPGHPYQPPLSVADALDAISLNITSAATQRGDVLDVSVAQLPQLAATIGFAARDGKLRLYPDSGPAINLGRAPVDQILTTLANCSLIELALVDKSDRLSLRRRIHIWSHRGDHLEARGERAPVKRVAVDGSRILYPGKLISEFAVTRPVDAVYTWVNSADPEWQKMLLKVNKKARIDSDRFTQSDELKFSIRSLELFAPWIRRIFIYSNCAPPQWFKPSERYVWVSHDDVGDNRHLPTFNSHSIETMLHKVPEISEQFVYLNDDFFLAGFVDPGDFFTVQGRSVCHLEPYGTVTYWRQLVERGLAEEWQSAAVNSATILERDFGVFPTRMHLHLPYALSRSVYEEIESRYADDIERVRSNRFRHHNDVSFTSFFYHHYALANGYAVEQPESSYIVRHTNAERFERSFMNGERSLRFFCINDGRGSADDNAYLSFKQRFLDWLYPFKSGAEA